MPAMKTTTPLLSDDLPQTDQKRFDRENLPVSVLHLGPGAFFRAHQMDYFDRLNETDPRWGVATVALRSMETADKLTPQKGVYTLVTLDEEISFRPIRSLLHVHHASEEAALSYFASADLTLLTMTITEKGYCLDASGELDLSNFQIASDLETPDAPKSAIGWIAKGLSPDGVLYMFPRKTGIVLGGTTDYGEWDRTPKPDEITRMVEGHAELMTRLTI